MNRLHYLVQTLPENLANNRLSSTFILILRYRRYPDARNLAIKLAGARMYITLMPTEETCGSNSINKHMNIKK